MLANIYGLKDELKKRMLHTFLENWTSEKEYTFEDALSKTTSFYKKLYSKGDIDFLTTPYYVRSIFLEHACSSPGFKNFIKTINPNKQMKKEDIIIKLFKKNMSKDNDFDKSVNDSISFMKLNKFEIEKLEFIDVLAKQMYISLKPNLKNTLIFIKKANKEELQQIINEAQSYLVA